MTGSAPDPVVAVLSDEWTSITELSAELGPHEWELPSECPGWTVRDLVSHMIGTERALLGEAPPPGPADRAPHVHNDVGAANEAWVQARRSWPGSKVLDEFREVTARRLEQLLAAAPERFERLGPSPVGEVPYREFMRVRVMDCWIHEQDMRVATGRPGHRQGAPAEIAVDRLVSAMPYVVAKGAAAPEGTGVRFDLRGAAARRFDVAVRDGRGRSEPVDDPTVALDMDTEIFWRLSCGRMSGDGALDAALVEISGDLDVGRRIVRHMAFMI